MGVPVDKFKEEVFATDMKEQLPTAWKSANGFDFNNFKDLLELVFADDAGKDEICQKGVDSHGVHFTFVSFAQWHYHVYEGQLSKAQLRVKVNVPSQSQYSRQIHISGKT